MEQLSPEVKVRIDDFLNFVETKFKVDEYDEYELHNESFFEVKPKMVIEYLKEKGFSENDIEDYGEEIIYSFSKENPNYDENDENSLETFYIKILINYLNFSFDLCCEVF